MVAIIGMLSVAKKQKQNSQCRFLFCVEMYCFFLLNELGTFMDQINWSRKSNL